MNKLLAVLIATVFTTAATVSLAIEDVAASTPVSKTVKVEKHTKKRVKVEKKEADVAHKAHKGHKAPVKKVEENASVVVSKH